MLIKLHCVLLHGRAPHRLARELMSCRKKCSDAGAVACLTIQAKKSGRRKDVFEMELDENCFGRRLRALSGLDWNKRVGWEREFYGKMNF